MAKQRFVDGVLLTLDGDGFIPRCGRLPGGVRFGPTRR